MSKYLDHIILNGKAINSYEIAAFEVNNFSISEWEKELYLFLKEWFSEGEYIEVQTSGSTGSPQKIKFSKKIMMSSAQRTIKYFGLKELDSALLSLPCRYIAGKMMVVRAIVGRMDLVTCDPSGNFDILNRDFALGALVINQVYKILESKKGKEKLEYIQNLLIGGSSIPFELESRLSVLGNRIVSTYGMTETASHIAIREISGPFKSDCYNCLEGITINVDENDCLRIHCPEIGDIQTNDIAVLHSPECFEILGRYDNVIISGGKKYFPEVIEKKLESLIQQRYIISSVPDVQLGQKIILVIEGDSFSSDLLMDHIKKVLLIHECPKKVYFLASFPETENGKMLRGDISFLIQSRSIL